MRPQTDGSYASSLYLCLMPSRPRPMGRSRSFSSSSSTLPRGLTLRHPFVLSFEQREGHLSSSSSLGQNGLCQLRSAIRLVGETAPGEEEDQHREHDDEESQEQEDSCRRNHREPASQGDRCPI